MNKQSTPEEAELPTTSDLFKKHFPEVYGGAGVGLMHPNIESFFEELNQVCIEEDKRKTQPK